MNIIREIFFGYISTLEFACCLGCLLGVWLFMHRITMRDVTPSALNQIALLNAPLIALTGLAVFSVEGHVARGFHSTAAVDETHVIRDLGFRATAPLHAWAAAGARASLLGAANSAVLVCFFGELLWHVLVRGRVCLAYQWLAIQSLRALAGACTALPRPATLLTSPLDFPNQYHADAAFFFSGHVALYALVAARKAAGQLSGGMAAGTAVVLAAVSAVLMLAMRGHYSIDILAGALVGVTVAPHHHACDAFAHRVACALGGTRGLDSGLADSHGDGGGAVQRSSAGAWGADGGRRGDSGKDWAPPPEAY